MVHGIKRGVIQFLTVTILSGICLVFGFAPDEFLAGLVTDPPPWLSHPALRFIALILGGVLGYVGWRVSRPLREGLFSAEMKSASIDPETARKWHKQRDWKRQPWARPVLITAIIGVVLIVVVLGSIILLTDKGKPSLTTENCTGQIKTVDEGRVRSADFPDHWVYSRTIRLEALSTKLIGVRFEARSGPGAELKVLNVVRPSGKPSPLDSYGQLEPEGIYYFVHQPNEVLRIIVVAKKPELIDITTQFKYGTDGTRQIPKP